ncbi:thioredoxin family protein [Desulfosporosinus sp. FKB]|uniref:thioredoxin family protein n=1 Tax=Desulfosporosinus sp. FKB TaxID=1969835 RepID=UPI000B49F681|nr:thioredoxin family protein [Desulfosporosinus sp. FKB]
MEIKILSTGGCANCKKMEQLVLEVLKETKTAAEVIKVTEIKEIMSFGVMSTPCLVINNKVKIAGKLPAKNTIKEFIMSEDA